MSSQRYRYVDAGGVSVSTFAIGQQPAGAVAVPADYDAVPYRYDEASKTFALDTAAMDKALCDRIDADREVREMAVLTAGGAKKYVYARKAAEVHDHTNVIGSLLAALTQPQIRQRFPFAAAEAAATGDTLAVVIARYAAGIAASQAEVARIEAAAMKAKRAVRAATSPTAKMQAANVSWGTP